METDVASTKQQPVNQLHRGCQFVLMVWFYKDTWQDEGLLSSVFRGTYEYLNRVVNYQLLPTPDDVFEGFVDTLLATGIAVKEQSRVTVQVCVDEYKSTLFSEDLVRFKKVMGTRLPVHRTYVCVRV